MKQKQTHKFEKEKIFTIQENGSLRKDIDAISVFDYLHTDENDGDYRMNTQEFGDVVSNVLRKQTFNLAIKRVLTANDGTVLRMKNVNYEMSPNFREFRDEDVPVVIVGGIWSNLFSHEWLGIRLANGVEIKSRDAWLIELTGGPNTECDDCPNYDMDDLADYYFPSYIAGVQANTGESQVDVVSFSNGCGVALRSLDKYQDGGKNESGNDAGEYLNETGSWVPMGMGDNSTRKFVGVGCPGAFEGDSLFKNCLESVENVDEFFDGLGKHVDKKDLAKQLASISIWDSLDCYMIRRTYERGDDIKIPSNLIKSYYDIIKDETDSQPGNFDVDKATIIYGFGGANGLGNEQDDGMVTVNDNLAIAQNLNAESKSFGYEHGKLIYGGGEIVGLEFNSDFPYIFKRTSDVYNYIIEEGLK